MLWITTRIGCTEEKYPLSIGGNLGGLDIQAAGHDLDFLLRSLIITLQMSIGGRGIKGNLIIDVDKALIFAQCQWLHDSSTSATVGGTRGLRSRHRYSRNSIYDIMG